MVRRRDSLEVAENHRFQQLEWRVGRVAWIIGVVLILAAAAGLFGNGPLSHRTVSTPGGAMEVDYQRFARDGGTTSLVARVAPGQSQEGKVEIWISNQYLGKVRVEQVTPEAESRKFRDQGVAFSFSSPDSRSQLQVRFRLRPDSVGPQHGEVGLGNRPPLRVSQFFYP